MAFRAQASKTIKWSLSIVFILQLAVAILLMAVDSIRKRGRPIAPFPFMHKDDLKVGDDAIEIYTYGETLYADMLDAINNAEHTIYLETFIWKADPVGRRFRQALTRATRRGVKVYVIYDIFANLVVNPKFFHFPEAINVRRHPLFSGSIWRFRNTGRDHNKLLVVDSEVAFVGGYNIGSLYATGWRDTHARFTGPIVADFENAFADQWNSYRDRRIKRPNELELLPEPKRRGWESPIKLHRNLPRLAVFPIRNMYLEAIDRASDHIYLTQAYFIPDEDLRVALLAAVKRKVDVRVIIPAESNHIIADWISRGYYDELLSAGLRIFLYEDAMIHAKTGTIDGRWSTIGTANLDRLSLAGNYEINAEIISTDIAAAMEEIFQLDLTNCRELSLEEWRRRSRLAKLTELLLAPWRPLF